MHLLENVSMGVLTFTEPYFPSHTQPSSVCSVHEILHVTGGRLTELLVVVSEL